MKVNELIIKDIRSFAGEQRLAIRPITYLVGENSTGKTTALACLQVMGRQMTGDLEEEVEKWVLTPIFDFVFRGFNTPPYEMGSFEEVVHKTKPPLQEFMLGVTYVGAEAQYCEQRIIFFRDGESIEKEASVRQVEWKFKNGTIIVVSSDSGAISVKYDKNEKKFTVATKLILDGSIAFLATFSSHFLKGLPSHINATEEDLEALFEFLEQNHLTESSDFKGFFLNPKSYSIAPIRSKPKRTYDSLKQGPDPEGDNTPNFLMNLYLKDKQGWECLRSELVAFGKNSGLFDDVTVKTYGSSSDNPFQIKVKTKGVTSNLVDVGYGVSQILPILARVHNKKDSTFLIQQPELHMHPKGQAALASLLIEHTKTRGNNYVIETHSDYMIDRTRIEISKGRIAPEDVSLIFLERKGKQTKVHNITFDDQANFVGAPVSYGDFFITEANRLMGFE